MSDEEYIVSEKEEKKKRPRDKFDGDTAEKGVYRADIDSIALPQTRREIEEGDADIKTKRIGAGDEDIENKFEEQKKSPTRAEKDRIQKLGQEYKSHFKKRPGPTPKYKTQYSER